MFHVSINEMLSQPEGYVLIGSYNVVVHFIQRKKKSRLYHHTCVAELKDALSPKY